jgi:hypothetical protein
MRDVAKTAIASAMWGWTADGFDLRRNVVRHDLVKYNIELLPASADAVLSFERTGGSKDLRHEHVVPRTWLANYIVQNDLSVDEICAYLSRCCRAVIVTKAEDSLLNPRNAMPLGWDHQTGNPFALYVECGLLSKLRNCL